MPGQEWRLQIGKVRERQSHIIELLRAQILTWRRRLQRQHGRPQRLLLEPCPEFTAARYENGQKKSDAVITAKQNGVLIQDHFKINGPTGGGQKEKPEEDVQTGPLYLQGHGNPVFYRNVWILEKK